MEKEDIFEVGTFRYNGGIIHVDVYGNEGNLEPHMHLYSDNGVINTAICIYKPKYLYGHNANTTKLNPVHVNKFNQFITTGNRWAKAKDYWNKGRLNTEHYMECNIPDYTQLK